MLCALVELYVAMRDVVLVAELNRLYSYGIYSYGLIVMAYIVIVLPWR